MKRYILFGFSLLVAFPLAVFAQDEEGDEESLDFLKPKRTVTVKNYETRTVKGLVIDGATKKPIAGAIVRAADFDGYSVLTDDNGTYELSVPVFSSALYITTPDFNPVQMGLVKGEQQREVKLYPSTFAAEYGAKTNVLNEYVANDFKYTNAINIKDEVQKQLGGQVRAITRSGMPGIGSTLFIQGLNSLNVNAQPLIVIDGVVVDQQYSRVLLHDGFYNDVLSNLNPADIEKVTVLRNGTALYGSKGANGVILVDTRRNKSMATRITANISAGVVLEPKLISIMDAGQYRSYASEMLKSTNTLNRKFKFLVEDRDYYYYDQYHQNTDWKDYVYHTAMTQNYGINVEGGDAVANYNLSVGYTSAESALKYNDMDRLNVRFNTDISLLRDLSVRFDASFANQTRNIRNDGAPETYDAGTPTSPSFLAYVKSPFMSPYSYGHDESGKGRFSDSHFDLEEESYLSEAMTNYPNYNWKLGNPAAINEYGDAEVKNRFENSMLNLTITPKYEFNSHLFVSEHFSYNLVNTNEQYYIPVNGTPSYYVTSLGGFRNNEVRSLASKQNSVQSDTRIDFNKRFGAHFVHAFAGARINWESFTSNNLLSYNTGSDKTPFHTSNDKTIIGVSENWNSLSWYLQGEYNYMSRYYLQANLTVDGSSRFGSESGDIKLFKAPWAIFPGLQASWVITNEPWMAGIKGIDYLRLSAGFDMTGNDDIDYYAARSYFRASRFLQKVSGLAFEGIGNNSVQWETTTRLNLGLEGGFLDNRIHVGFNYFRSRTNNLLTRQTLGFLSGLSENWSNSGKLENNGFDVNFTAKVIAIKDWQWQVGASAGHYKNEVTALPDGKSLETNLYGATILTEVGQPVGVFYGYKTEGVFTTQAQADNAALYQVNERGQRMYFAAGDMHFADLDGNHVIDEADRTVIGDPNPDIYGNIYTRLAWKQWTLNATMNYSLGNDIYNYQRALLEGGSQFYNQTTAMNSRWTTEGQQTDIPRVSYGDPMGNARFSDRWIEDGSYLRLANVTLAYELPIQSTYLQGITVWGSAQNLFTLTRYLGGDPDCALSGSVLAQGIDRGLLARGRSFSLGIKINL